MSTQVQQITDYCRQFRTAGISKQLQTIIQQAEATHMGYMEFTLTLLKAEAENRHLNDVNRRLKVARLPHHHNLDLYRSCL